MAHAIYGPRHIAGGGARPASERSTRPRIQPGRAGHMDRHDLSPTQNTLPFAQLVSKRVVCDQYGRPGGGHFSSESPPPSAAGAAGAAAVMYSFGPSPHSPPTRTSSVSAAVGSVAAGAAVFFFRRPVPDRRRSESMATGAREREGGRREREREMERERDQDAAVGQHAGAVARPRAGRGPRRLGLGPPAGVRIRAVKDDKRL
jgi:hypothetical protein